MRSAIFATILPAIVVAVFAAHPAHAQTAPPAPSAENLAAARELVQAAKMMDNFKQVLPIVVQNLKQTVVQNRPEVEKQYDALMPRFDQAANQRLNELADTMATIYARNFSVDELHDITAFFRSPTGQKYLQLTPTLTQQIMAAGQQFGREVAQEAQRLSGQIHQ
ncbi:MAG TPA: DUF2059 domain-containing protein [Xanthobacteraceae bacterium]